MALKSLQFGFHVMSDIVVKTKKVQFTKKLFNNMPCLVVVFDDAN